MSGSMTDVVITGIGIASPLGEDRETTWQRVQHGDSGLAWIDAEQRWAGGRIPGSRVDHSVGDLAELVTAEAWADSGLELSQTDPIRLGCVFGTSKGELRQLLEQAPETPWWTAWPAGAASRLAGRWNCQGPVLAPVAACATGLTACIRAAELLRADLCDVVLAGSADASLFPAVIGSFQRLGVLARGTGDPADWVRPFDRQHAGFLIGEGAACLVMERQSHAAARGANWYGEWLGGRLGSDPVGITQSDPSGQSLARLLQDLQADTGVTPDYLNLHGTATRRNDRAECHAVQLAYGAAATGVACSGFKGHLGHLLGAAGSVELALTLLALRDQTMPATRNLSVPAEGCELNFFGADHHPLETAVKISAGFGGHLAVAAVRRGTKSRHAESESPCRSSWSMSVPFDHSQAVARQRV